MIIVRIANGLGNQMFQYALGRALAIKNNCELVLDISSFKNQVPGEAIRHYSLDNFNTAGRTAEKKDFKKLGITPPWKKNLVFKIIRMLRRIIEDARPIQKRKVVVESQFTYIPEVSNITKDCFLIGVWQSEKYFESIKNTILKDFTLKNPLSKEAASIKELIISSESVMVHVRRGDQVSDPHLAKKHGILTEEYYKLATSYINSRISNAHFFIFSDEIEWVKENIKFGSATTYVSDLGLPDYEEIILMSLCKHDIIAKSSYSWWGAWLNTYKDKIIITPKDRFGVPGNDHDLIPSEWIRF